jgi:hypothetical protein
VSVCSCRRAGKEHFPVGPGDVSAQRRRTEAVLHRWERRRRFGADGPPGPSSLHGGQALHHRLGVAPLVLWGGRAGRPHPLPSRVGGPLAPRAAGTSGRPERSRGWWPALGRRDEGPAGGRGVAGPSRRCNQLRWVAAGVSELSAPRASACHSFRCFCGPCVLGLLTFGLSPKKERGPVNPCRPGVALVAEGIHRPDSGKHRSTRCPRPVPALVHRRRSRCPPSVRQRRPETLHTLEAAPRSRH